MNDPRQIFPEFFVPRDLDELAALVRLAAEHCHPLQVGGGLPWVEPDSEEDLGSSSTERTPSPDEANSLHAAHRPDQAPHRAAPPAGTGSHQSELVREAPPSTSSSDQETGVESPAFEEEDLDLTWGAALDEIDEEPASGPFRLSRPRPASAEDGPWSFEGLHDDEPPAFETDPAEPAAGVDSPESADAASDLPTAGPPSEGPRESLSPIERYLASRGADDITPEAGQTDEAPDEPFPDRSRDPLGDASASDAEPEEPPRDETPPRRTDLPVVEAPDLDPSPMTWDLAEKEEAPTPSRRIRPATRESELKTLPTGNLDAPTPPASAPERVASTTNALKVEGRKLAPHPAHAYPATFVSMARFTTHFEHDAADLTLTCDAGWPLETLDEHLATAGQRLPFEYPKGRELTLGSAVAAGVDGFNAMLHGPIRDQILGLGYLDGRGRRARCGGRVVKNVTGYDLVRLHTGAGGRFGILHEITLRLRPIPPATATFLFPGEELDAAHELALGLRRIGARVSALVILAGRVVPDDFGDLVTALRVEGHPTSIDACREWLRTAPPFRELESSEAERFWPDLLRYPLAQGFSHALRLRPGRLLAAAKEFAPSRLREDAALIVDVGNARLAFTEAKRPQDVDRRIAELDLSAIAERHAGAASMPRDPEDRLRRRDRFGAPPAAMVSLIDRVTVALDPAGVFAPRPHLRAVGGSA